MQSTPTDTEGTRPGEHPESDSIAESPGSWIESLRHREDWPQPLKFTPPVTFKVELATPDRVNSFLGRTGVEVTGHRTVQATGQTFWEAWDAFWYRT